MNPVERLLGDAQPRADARRNVERLVEAAQAAIAEVGTGVTAHDIARRAGVGIGTFYRRMPSREALLVAVLESTLEEIVALADAALTADEPWRGFCDFAADFVRLRATSCGLRDALADGGSLDIDEALAAVRDRLGRLVARAQAAGVLRADLDWRDVAFLLAAIVPPDHTLGLEPAPDQWSTSLGVVLGGLARG